MSHIRRLTTHSLCVSAVILIWACSSSEPTQDTTESGGTMSSPSAGAGTNQGGAAATNGGTSATPGGSPGAGAGGAAGAAVGGAVSGGNAAGGVSTGGNGAGGVSVGGNANAGSGTGGTTSGGAAAGGSSGSGGSATGGSGNACPVALVGWATANSGTTGGGNAAPQRVTSLAELRSLAGDSSARVIEIAGTISTGSDPIEIKSNKTLVGVDKNATIKGGLNISDGSSNIIVRNLNILGVGTSSNSGEPVDTIAARGSHHLWFDHLNIGDGPDGMLDLTRGSDHATISWCKFWYTTKNRDHRLAVLLGGGSTHGDTDTGKNNHTIHHNWFAQNVDQRMPRLLFGKGHIFNNYYNSPGNGYCIGSGSFASLLVENNYFKGVANPHQFADGNHAYIAATGNVYDNTSGNRQTGLGGSDGASVGPWTPAYSYALDKADDVPSIVQRCAGPQ